MHIKEIKWQMRRDFKAIYSCEYCGHEEEGHGYDDRNFHDNVIPKMECKNCGKNSGENYATAATKYPDWMTV